MTSFTANATLLLRLRITIRGDSEYNTSDHILIRQRETGLITSNVRTVAYGILDAVTPLESGTFSSLVQHQIGAEQKSIEIPDYGTDDIEDKYIVFAYNSLAFKTIRIEHLGLQGKDMTECFTLKALTVNTIPNNIYYIGPAFADIKEKFIVYLDATS